LQLPKSQDRLNPCKNRNTFTPKRNQLFLL